jgi:hypothetical protein
MYICRKEKIREYSFYRFNYPFQDFHTSGTLGCVGWQLITDVSGLSIDPIFKGQAVEEEDSTRVLDPCKWVR